MLAGCVSTPENEFRERPAPDWVLTPPGTTETVAYFVASGTDDSGDVAAAEEQAAASLLVQINQAVGIDVSVLTIAEAQASADSYDASVVQQITQSGGGRVVGFSIEDRYVAPDANRVTVHLLGAYEQRELRAERTRREQLVRRQEDLYLGPFRDAERLAAEGDSFQAVRLYLQSAESAARAPESLGTAGPTSESALRAATDLLASLVLEPVSGPAEVQAMSLPDSEVVFRVTDSVGRDVPRVPVEIALVGPDRGRVQRVLVQSYEDGRVTYRLPRPDMAGDYRVTARLSTAEIEQYLRGLPDSLRAARGAVEAEIARIGSSWTLISTSRATEIPTTVLVVDALHGGVVGDMTEAGIADALSSAGFSLVALSIADRSALPADRAALLAATQQGAQRARRAVIGTASISEVSEPDGFLVRVRGNLSVIDLETLDVVYATSAIKNARSATRDQAVSVAFYQLGVALGEELVARLP